MEEIVCWSGKHSRARVRLVVNSMQQHKLKNSVAIEALKVNKMGAHVHDKKENLEMCSCAECPSFNGSPLTGALFCARGKAEMDILEAGCNCSFCAVADKYGLKFEYYCVRGKSADIP